MLALMWTSTSPPEPKMQKCKQLLQIKRQKWSPSQTNTGLDHQLIGHLGEWNSFRAANLFFFWQFHFLKWEFPRTYCDKLLTFALIIFHIFFRTWCLGVDYFVYSIWGKYTNPGLLYQIMLALRRVACTKIFINDLINDQNFGTSKSGGLSYLFSMIKTAERIKS